MADTRYRVTAASITLHPHHPHQLQMPEATPSRPDWAVTPEGEWRVQAVRLTQGMLLPADVNPADVAQLLNSGLIEAVQPNASHRDT
jgi:hypothetical protein